MSKGYTNRNFVCIFVSYFPFLVQHTAEITTTEQYEILRNVIYSFNIGAKMIFLLHEILIHLSYAYLDKLTGGEIKKFSKKTSKNSKNNDDINEIGNDKNGS